MRLGPNMRELWRSAKMMKSSLGCPLPRHYSASKSQSYEDAIAALNSLQSNAACIQQARQQPPSAAKRKLSLMWEYLDLIGLHQNDLSNLSIIHIAGTKGKGSTCAYCESILRENGYRTGFFSSPHLVSVCERIRINGRSLCQNDFVRYFWPVYNKILMNKSPEIQMPSYFAFMTVVAFSVFVSEKVDVAVMEVGIGGEFDCTNIIPNSCVVGITSLGLDHTDILGKTMSSIAWHKSGIMKPSAVGFTVPDNCEEVLKVLGERSVERKCPLEIVPLLENYDWPSEAIRKEMLSLVPAQKTNSSLALQITHAWMKKQNDITGIKSPPSLQLSRALPFRVTSKTARGLQACKWPGRMQTLKSRCGHITFCLDGAHTKESVLVCLNWFEKLSSEDRSEVRQALIFNVTGTRDITELLVPFTPYQFDRVFFSPNIAYEHELQGDRANMTTTRQVQGARCQELLKQWKHLHHSTNQDVSQASKVVSCVAEAIAELEAEEGEWRVLVTGSLHLIGALLSIIDPTLERSEDHVTCS